MDLSSDISSLEDDIQEFNIERDIKTSLKTQEELDKLTVDENLNDIERAVFLLSSGQEIQCISVVRNLPQLIKAWQNECIRRVVPNLKELLHTAGIDLQMVATEVFMTIAKDDLLPISIYTQHFLRTIITSMNAKDPVVSQSWLNCLISVIAYLPRDVVRREILGLAVAKGQLSQPTASRLSCCSILGAVAPKFDSNVIRKDIIPTVKQLCQDVEHIVRTCMCAHLHSIANALGSDEAKSSILEEVLELAVDEESQVREAALDCLLNMTSLLDDDILKCSVVPLVCKYCEQAVQNEDQSLLTVVKNLGRFCHSLSANFNTEQQSWFLATYRYLCTLGRRQLDPSLDNCSEFICSSANMSFSHMPDAKLSSAKSDEYVEFRRQCAYNFPALTVFCTVSLFQTQLLSTLSMLCTDPDVAVRKSIAAGLHEVAQTLQANAHLIQPHLVHLLRERNSPSVLEACLKRLPDTLVAVIIRGNLVDNKTNGVSELIGALLSAISKLEQQWPSSWRPLETLVTHLRRLPDVFTSDQIYYKFVNVVFKLLTSNRYLPVREAAACSVCVFIRHNKKVEQRTEMCNRLIQDLCYARNYRHRILFFTACHHMMVLFSRTYFKEHLFEHVLRLFDDPVPNVRLCLCKILPSLKSLLKLPRDRILHGSLESSVRKLLSTEKDRDVSTSIRQIIFELDRTEVTMESITQHPLEVDLIDRQKEFEERLLVEKEEKAKDEDARSSRSHGSSHSSSSMGKSIVKNEKVFKKRRSSSFVVGTKANGNKEKGKSSQYLSVPTGPSVTREPVLSSQSSTLSMYNMSSGSNPSNRNLASHFSHTSYITSPGNPSSQSPSTALGHKTYQTLAAVRPSAGTGTSSGFRNSINPQIPSDIPTSIKSNRKNERRASSLSHQGTNTLVHDVINYEQRTRKNSTGSVSSTGSGDKTHRTRRHRNSLPGGINSSNRIKNKKIEDQK